MLRGMSEASRGPMTEAEFLAWEERQDARLRGRPCQVYGSDLKIRTARSIRYPDAFVACPAVPASATVADTAVVVFEVLSPGTARVDEFDKDLEYRDTPSIQRYVVLRQDRPGGLVWSRLGGDWIARVLGPDAILYIPEAGVTVPLAEFYEGVEFPDADAA